jgi:pantoate--beta-alanine ligase
MKVISNPYELQRLLTGFRKLNRSVGFVPTMGALHSGHLSLLERARRECDVVVLSIFVNPTQFNNPSDFDKYPRTVEADLELLKDIKIDFVFTPERNALYTDNYNYAVTERDKNAVLCGATRPGHFQGVLTIIVKLLNITQASKIYLGEKDYQQLEIIRGMVEAFFIPTEVVGCPTVRDEEGLALSSRNQRLSPQGVEKARHFAHLLKENKPLSAIRQELIEDDIKVDYLEELWGRRFGAVFIDDVRLIDNVPVL